MLAAYRNNLQPPSGDALRQHVQRLSGAEAEAPAAAKLAPTFAWSEYEQVVIAGAAARGNPIFHVALQTDPNCPMRAAAKRPGASFRAARHAPPATRDKTPPSAKCAGRTPPARRQYRHWPP